MGQGNWIFILGEGFSLRLSIPVSFQLDWSIFFVNNLVQLLGRFEEIWEKYKKINKYFISRSFDLKVFEEHIDSKNFEGLVDDILPSDSLKAGAARSIEFGSDLEDGQSTGESSFEVLVELAV